MSFSDFIRGDIHTQVAALNINMTFARFGVGCGLLTLTLALWQIDIFLILMWNILTMCRIMQLIETEVTKLSIMM